MGAIYFAILRRIERSGFAVLGHVIRVPRPVRAVIAAATWCRVMLLPSRIAYGPRVGETRTPRMNPSRHDVVVIGAGFAGLSAATALAARRYRVLVLEASSRLGGRATAFEDHATGELVDNGQHVLFGCYRETLAFLRRVGAESNVRLQRDLEVSIIDDSGRRSALACPPAPAPLHLLAGVLEWDALSIRDRLSVLKLVRPLRVARRRLLGRTRDLAASPGETVDEWLAVHGQTERVHRLLWEPLALAGAQPTSIRRRRRTVRESLGRALRRGANRRRDRAADQATPRDVRGARAGVSRCGRQRGTDGRSRPRGARDEVDRAG